MPVSAAERRFILNQLGQRAKEDMIRLWDAAGRFSDEDFYTFLLDAFPELADQYHQGAALLAATIFEEDFPVNGYTAAVAAPIPREQLRNSTEWALGASGRQALDRMSGTLQRAIYDGDRTTTAANAEQLGMRWVRVARPNACAFCRMLASRSVSADNLYLSDGVVQNPDGTYKTVVVGRSVSLTVSDRRMIQSGFMSRDQALARRIDASKVYQRNSRYGSKGQSRSRALRGSRRPGDDYHDECQCTARAIPAGYAPMDVLSADEPEFAVDAQMWMTEYEKARDASGSGDPKKILAAWRQLGAS